MEKRLLRQLSKVLVICKSRRLLWAFHDTVTMMLCIHRLPKKNGVRCSDSRVHGTAFCASHRRFCGKAIFYEVDTFLGDETELTATNIFSCFSRIWTKYQGDSDISAVKSSFVGMEILSYIMNHNSIDSLANQLGISYERGQKQTAIMEIVLLMRKLWQVQTTPRLVKALTVFQRKIKRAILPDMGPYPMEPAVNNEDIFTLEPLTMIDPSKVFSFRDHRGQVFAFHAGELAKHVYVFRNAFNPLTREPLALSDLIRLRTWANIYTKEPIDDTVITKTWSTPMLAFTEITSEFERSHGIFTQPAWYTAFDQYDIMTVFVEFHKSAGRGCPFMSCEAEEEAFESGDPMASSMVLAKEMYRLVTDADADNHMYYVCCLFVALSQVSVEIADSLPQWVYDVVG